MHRSDYDLKSENKSLQRIQLITLEYGVSFLTDTSDAILLNTILASLPIPPVEENTKGENEPCSISLTLWPYTHLFSDLCLLYAVDNWAERLLCALG